HPLSSPPRRSPFFPWGPRVMSSGRLHPVPASHSSAAGLPRHSRPTEVLSIGDQDGSGVWMFAAYLEEVEAFTRELGGVTDHLTFVHKRELQDLVEDLDAALDTLEFYAACEDYTKIIKPHDRFCIEHALEAAAAYLDALRLRGTTP